MFGFRTPGMLFEAVPDAGAGGGGAPAVDTPAAETAAVDTPAVEAPAPAIPAFDWDDPRLTDMVDQRASQIAQQTLDEMVRRAQAQHAQQAPQPGFDPAQMVDEYGNFDPRALPTLMQTRDERLLAQVRDMFTPLASQMQAAQEAETVAQGEARLEDMLADDIARNGDFVRAAGNSDEQIAAAQKADADARQLVRTVADQMFPEIAQRYGATPRAAEIAMTRAADQVRSLLRAAGQSGVAAHTNQMATLAGQTGEAGGPGAGAAAVSRPVVKFGERVTDRYAAAGNPIQ